VGWRAIKKRKGRKPTLEVFPVPENIPPLQRIFPSLFLHSILLGHDAQPTVWYYVLRTTGIGFFLFFSIFFSEG